MGKIDGYSSPQPHHCGVRNSCYCNRPKGHPGPHVAVVGHVDVVDVWGESVHHPPLPDEVSMVIDTYGLSAAEHGYDNIATRAARDDLVAAIIDIYAAADAAKET